MFAFFHVMIEGMMMLWWMVERLYMFRGLLCVNTDLSAEKRLGGFCIFFLCILLCVNTDLLTKKGLEASGLSVFCFLDGNLRLNFFWSDCLFFQDTGELFAQYFVTAA